MKHVWYSPSPRAQSPDTIHQILAYGTLDDIRSLKETLGEDVVKELFLHFPKKVYTASALYFVKNVILHISDPLDERSYLKHTPRHTR